MNPQALDAIRNRLTASTNLGAVNSGMQPAGMGNPPFMGEPASPRFIGPPIHPMPPTMVGGGMPWTPPTGTGGMGGGAGFGGNSGTGQMDMMHPMPIDGQPGTMYPSDHGIPGITSPMPAGSYNTYLAAHPGMNDEQGPLPTGMHPLNPGAGPTGILQRPMPNPAPVMGQTPPMGIPQLPPSPFGRF